jgi:hypothetical protein
MRALIDIPLSAIAVSHGASFPVELTRLSCFVQTNSAALPIVSLYANYIGESTYSLTFYARQVTQGKYQGVRFDMFVPKVPGISGAPANAKLQFVIDQEGMRPPYVVSKARDGSSHPSRKKATAPKLRKTKSRKKLK